MRRGDVVWVDFDPVRGSEADKPRPAIVVSNDGANRTAQRVAQEVVTVVPVTSRTSRVYPFQVLLPPRSSGLPPGRFDGRPREPVVEPEVERGHLRLPGGNAVERLPFQDHVVGGGDDLPIEPLETLQGLGTGAAGDERALAQSNCSRMPDSGTQGRQRRSPWPAGVHGSCRRGWRVGALDELLDLLQERDRCPWPVSVGGHAREGRRRRRCQRRRRATVVGSAPASAPGDQQQPVRSNASDQLHNPAVSGPGGRRGRGRGACGRRGVPPARHGSGPPARKRGGHLFFGPARDRPWNDCC